ncbi:MAG TPA: hypothetical protein DIU45_05575 [Clostridium sp.]|nr:hypothetical protein [Clostridium sp.]
MDLMNKEDFNNLLKSSLSKYYEGRWTSFSEVINIIKQENEFEKVLELGPAFQTIVKNCDIMVKPEIDVWGRPEKYINKEFKNDATVVPWPIEDRTYDLFIALQVWEYLEGKQKEAFEEVMRTSKAAILSFPYMWDCPKDNANYPEHHMIDEKIISEWTLNVNPKKVIKIPRTGDRVSKGPRIIYFWKNNKHLSY